MNVSRSEFRELIERARGGDRDAAGELLEHHRPYLKLLTLRVVGERIGSRLDDSDIVQQTCMSVFGNIQQFDGRDPDEFVAWIRMIHERNIKNVLRDHVGAQKRSLQREEPWSGTTGAGDDVSAAGSSPSQRLLQGERAVRLAVALNRLPEDQRTAVRLRYLEGWSLLDISETMNRTKFSVAGLVKRGLINLRKELNEPLDW